MNIVNITPTFGRVLVRPLEKETTSGGIIIPDTVKEPPQLGEVLRTGGRNLSKSGKLSPMNVSVGDQVLYGKYAGTSIEVDEEELLILGERDLLCIVEDNS